MTRRVTQAVAAVSVVLVTTGCASTPRPRVDIGMSRIALDRAFTDSKLPPLPPKVIIRIIPAPPAVATSPQPDLSPYVVPPNQPAPPLIPVPATPSCPKAPPGASVPGTAPLTFPKSVKPGRYSAHNTGTITVTSAGTTFRFPYPPRTTIDISTAKPVSVPTVTGLPVTTPHTQFDYTTTLSPGHTVLERFQYDGSTLDLVSRAETNAGKTDNEVWSPAVEQYTTAGPGQTWQSIASDQGLHHALGIQGSVDSKPVVDICGSLIETVQASAATTIVDLASGQTSGTTAGEKDVLRLATGYGPLIAQREIHTTQVQSVNGVPVTIVTNAVSTLDSLDPQASR